MNTSCRMKHARRHNGFTLIEILMVLAVLVLLAAILFPVFSRARESGRRAACQSNLKQIALAMQQYVQDSDGRFPLDRYQIDQGNPTARFIFWTDAIMPYTKSSTVFQCPSSGIRDPEYKFGYVFNNRDLNDIVDIVFDSDGNPKQIKIAGSHESKHPLASTIVLNYDSLGQHKIVMETSCGLREISNIHSGGANFSSLDSHVKWLNAEKIIEFECFNQPKL